MVLVTTTAAIHIMGTDIIARGITTARIPTIDIDTTTRDIATADIDTTGIGTISRGIMGIGTTAPARTGTGAITAAFIGEIFRSAHLSGIHSSTSLACRRLLAAREGWNVVRKKMPDRYRSGVGKVDDGANVPLAPALALAMWNPFLAGALGGNAQAIEALSEIAREWQDFVARRLKEDFALAQRLTSSSTPDHIMAAYADFWRKAAEDYGGEVATMAKLMTAITNKMVMAAQSATDEASTKLLHGHAA